MARQMPKIDPKALTAVYQRAAMIGRLIREQGMTPANINRLRECIHDLRKLGAVHPMYQRITDGRREGIVVLAAYLSRHYDEWNIDRRRSQ